MIQIELFVDYEMDKKQSARKLNRKIKFQQYLLLVISALLISFMLVGCGPSAAELEAADYAPLPDVDWKVSTPAEQGLDPDLVAKLYLKAAELETLYGLLIVKNGHLIAEGYFNEGSIEQQPFMASATKSFTSALVGIALDQGCLSSVDQKMMDFFPKYADQIDDPRKKQITIRDLLQMRSGYVWEERTPYMESFFSSRGYWLPFIVEFPLTSDPGTEFGYSNLSSHILGVIVAPPSWVDIPSCNSAILTRIHLSLSLTKRVQHKYLNPRGYHLFLNIKSIY